MNPDDDDGTTDHDMVRSANVLGSSPLHNKRRLVADELPDDIAQMVHPLLVPALRVLKRHSYLSPRFFPRLSA